MLKRVGPFVIIFQRNRTVSHQRTKHIAARCFKQS